MFANFAVVGLVDVVKSVIALTASDIVVAFAKLHRARELRSRLMHGQSLGDNIGALL
jgi:hypothetical protein